MSYRTRLAALLVVFVGLALVATSGAFSTVTAERTVSVDTAADDTANLQLAPHTGASGAYASLNGGQLEISFDGVAADGVTKNATTSLNGVFNITNQGSQSASVYVTETGNYTSLVTFETANGTRIDGGAANGVSVPVGSTLEVTVVVDTTGQNLAAGTALLDSITIHARG